MREMLDEHELHFEADVNVCRYVNNEKELLNEEGQITIKQFNKLMDDKKATFQIHQPQRFNVSVLECLQVFSFGSTKINGYTNLINNKIFCKLGRTGLNKFLRNKLFHYKENNFNILSNSYYFNYYLTNVNLKHKHYAFAML